MIDGADFSEPGLTNWLSDTKFSGKRKHLNFPLRQQLATFFMSLYTQKMTI